MLQEAQSAGDCTTGYTVTSYLDGHRPVWQSGTCIRRRLPYLAPQPFAPGLEDERAKDAAGKHLTASGMRHSKLKTRN
ncbi:MAG: hypothetical protein IPM98_20235 [Lewinellaceae bacterium]|nr:hypothetical protein [Lewinellaceae bacterium]